MTDIITAHHEAAHVVVQYRAGGSAGGTVTIVADAAAGTLGGASDVASDSVSSEDMEARVLSCYAGGHAQRIVDASTSDDGCGQDDEEASKCLRDWAWEDREQELRHRSLDLVRQYWAEIVAVAEELLRVRALDMTEIEIIADAAAGDPDADLVAYRRDFGAHIEEWRRRATQPAKPGDPLTVE